MKYYTIYKITNNLNNYIYIGAHITKNVSDNYFGSSKHLKKDIKKLGKENFSKEILFIFNNKVDMINKEKELVNKEFCYRNDTYNRMIGGNMSSFLFNDMVTVKDKNGNNLKVYLDDPRYISGEFISISKNKVVVIDKEGHIFQVDKNDERYLSGELIHNLKNKIVVKDKTGNKFCVDKNDERYLSGELVGWAKDRPGIKGMLGKFRTKEEKENLSQLASLRTGSKSSSFGRIYINNGVDNKRVKFLDLDLFLNDGWIKGRKIFKNNVTN